MIRRTTNRIFIHCSATRPEQDIGAAEINRWHKENGWSGIGYHGVIRRNGSFEFARDFVSVGAHAKGFNSDSVAVCLIGGVGATGNPENNFTDAQFDTLRKTLGFLKKVYPMAEIVGHNQFSNKACPSFDVQKWLKNDEFVTAERF